VVDKVALEQIFLQVLQFYALNIIPPWLHTDISSGVQKKSPVGGHNSET
jgi:hypothetical protein